MEANFLSASGVVLDDGNDLIGSLAAGQTWIAEIDATRDMSGDVKVQITKANCLE